MAQLQTIEVKFMSVDFTVEGVYNKKIPGTHEQPEEGGDFEIHSVHICGNDVTGLLSKHTDDSLSCYINENIHYLI